jgi:hypothetical protein
MTRPEQQGDTDLHACLLVHVRLGVKRVRHQWGHQQLASSHPRLMLRRCTGRRSRAATTPASLALLCMPCGGRRRCYMVGGEVGRQHRLRHWDEGRQVSKGLLLVQLWYRCRLASCWCITRRRPR